MTNHANKVSCVPPYTCRDCGYGPDTAASTVDDGVGPEQGALSLCLNCGALSLFQPDMTQRPLTDDEWAALPAETLQHIARIETNRRRMFGGVLGNLTKKKKGRA